MRAAYRVKVDGSEVSFLPLCSCGWRDTPRTTRQAAWLACRRHEENCHPSGLQAAQALAKQAARDAATRRQSVKRQ